MFDLIYWNPEDNPMKYEEDECRIPLSNKEANGQTSTNAERSLEISLFSKYAILKGY